MTRLQNKNVHPAVSQNVIYNNIEEIQEIETQKMQLNGMQRKGTTL